MEIQIKPNITVKRMEESYLPKGTKVKRFPLFTLIQNVQQLPDGHYTINDTSIQFEISRKDNSLFAPSFQTAEFFQYIAQLTDLLKANQHIDEVEHKIKMSHHIDAIECRPCWGKGCVRCDYEGVINR